jgi:hypothetical protein
MISPFKRCAALYIPYFACTAALKRYDAVTEAATSYPHNRSHSLPWIHRPRFWPFGSTVGQLFHYSLLLTVTFLGLFCRCFALRP